MNLAPGPDVIANLLRLLPPPIPSDPGDATGGSQRRRSIREKQSSQTPYDDVDKASVLAERVGDRILARVLSLGHQDVHLSLLLITPLLNLHTAADAQLQPTSHA